MLITCGYFLHISASKRNSVSRSARVSQHEGNIKQNIMKMIAEIIMML